MRADSRTSCTMGEIPSVESRVPNLRSAPNSGDEGRHGAEIGCHLDVVQNRNDRHLRVRTRRVYGRLKSLGAKQFILFATNTWIGIGAIFRSAT